MSTTYKAKYRRAFCPLVFPASSLSVQRYRRPARQILQRSVAPYSLKTIQGEGGIRPLTQEFFAEARALTLSTGALLIADEIQCGMGRTGKWCAYQHFGILPDVTTLAKPLAGGVLWARLSARKKPRAPFTPACMATTFGGGPLACVVAIAVIDTLEKDHLLAHVTEVGNYFLAQLRALALRHNAIVTCAVGA